VSAVRRVAQRLPGRRPRAIVLLYHRVRASSVDPWRLAVAPEIFAEQMETLACDWTPLSLGELVEGLDARRLPERAVSVTFDDGYADNLDVAAPILLEHGIPATLFVAPELVERGGPPWWDELATLLLEPSQVPATLTLSSVHGDGWTIPPVGTEEQKGTVGAQPWEAKSGTRLRAFYEVWLTLRALDAPRREDALDEIAEWADTPRPSERALLTWDQLREFAGLPGFGIGAHTLTHPVLPSCSLEDARAEIAGSFGQLRAHLHVDVEQFAYPFGAWNKGVARLVADLGFRAAYTTEGGPISWSSSTHALPRVPAEEEPPEDFARMLKAVSGL
jgi:peptidoglycan/xylan/chitin deacetylase (PgdA/CDA1 family)